MMLPQKTALNQSSPSILDYSFPHHIFKTKPNILYQTLGGCLKEVITVGVLLSGQPEGGCGRWIEVVT